MTSKGIRRRICRIFVNHLLPAGRCFAARRRLMSWAGYRIGDGTRIFGPVNISGELTVGRNCWIGRNMTVHGNGSVVIGDNCDIAPDVTFFTGGHALGDHERRAGAGETYHITVGNGTWLGGRASILRNTRIGSGCVIAACACVTGDVPENVLAAGVPARVVKEFKDCAADTAEE